MDFYARQTAARRQTLLLIAGFIAAVAALTLSINVVLFTLLASMGDGPTGPLDFAARNPAGATFCTLLVLSVIGLASLYKTLQLRGGGGVVARSLGGVRVARDASDLKLKRLHNVVEEMAIASGVPMPEIYVLEQEAAINAFAAGHNPANAAIAVTQGALDRLSRDQLQGVIAHEFSHVLNGDMRLGVRLMGFIFGLLVIALIGRTILRIAPRGRRGSTPLLAAALAVMILGYVGLFAGRVLQAAVSRQRERLADASAVQFTRNPSGLKEALLKIAGLGAMAGLGAGSRIVNADPEQVAHMLFAPGLRRAFATHPPLIERIRALDPAFDPRTLDRIAAEALREEIDSDEPLLPTPPIAGLSIREPADIADQVGTVSTVHIEHAAKLRLALPHALREFVETSGRARILVLALLLSREDGLRARQLALLASKLSREDLAAIETAWPLVSELGPMLRLPALLQIFPALRRLPLPDRQLLGKHASDIITIDAHIDVFEFCLARLLATLLREEIDPRPPHGRLTLVDAQQPLHVLFATLAHCGAPEERGARMAYEAGMQVLFPRQRPAYALIADWPQHLAEALAMLEALQPYAKKTLIEGLVKTVAHDELLNVAEAELLRVVCALLQCPLPPLLPRTTAA